MQLRLQDIRRGGTYLMEVPDDERGLDFKLSVVKRMIRQSKSYQAVRDLAEQLAWKLQTKAEAIQAVYDFMQSNFEYVPDQEANDVFVAPHRQIQRIRESGQAWGDCDDYTIFGGAILYNMGIEVRPIVVATESSVNGEWNHIFFEANDGKDWVVFDAVRKGRPLGKTTKYTRRRVYPVIV